MSQVPSSTGVKSLLAKFESLSQKKENPPSKPMHRHKQFKTQSGWQHLEKAAKSNRQSVTQLTTINKRDIDELMAAGCTLEQIKQSLPGIDVTAIKNYMTVSRKRPQTTKPSPSKSEVQPYRPKSGVEVLKEMREVFHRIRGADMANLVSPDGLFQLVSGQDSSLSIMPSDKERVPPILEKSIKNYMSTVYNILGAVDYDTLLNDENGLKKLEMIAKIMKTPLEMLNFDIVVLAKELGHQNESLFRNIEIQGQVIRKLSSSHQIEMEKLHTASQEMIDIRVQEIEKKAKFRLAQAEEKAQIQIEKLRLEMQQRLKTQEISLMSRINDAIQESTTAKQVNDELHRLIKAVKSQRDSDKKHHSLVLHQERTQLNDTISNLKTELGKSQQDTKSKDQEIANLKQKIENRDIKHQESKKKWATHKKVLLKRIDVGCTSASEYIDVLCQLMPSRKTQLIKSAISINMHYKADTKKSIEYLEKLVEIGTANTGDYHNLACLYVAVGKIDSATDYFEKATSENPTSAACSEYAIFLFEQKNYESVIKLCKKALTLIRDNSGLSFNETQVDSIGPELKMMIKVMGGEISVTSETIAYRFMIAAQIELGNVSEAKNTLLQFESSLTNNSDEVALLLLEFARDQVQKTSNQQ